jgi:hypothetical protein
MPQQNVHQSIADDAQSGVYAEKEHSIASGAHSERAAPAAFAADAPVYRPSPQDLENFVNYVHRSFTEWESHGIVVLSIPPACLEKYGVSEMELTEALHQTMVQPRVQRFPQFAPSERSQRSPQKRVRRTWSNAGWPCFPESNRSMSAAAFRDQVRALDAQLVDWLQTHTRASLPATSEPETKSIPLETRLKWQKSIIPERVQWLEACFWEALEHGFGGHPRSVQYAIDIVGLSGSVSDTELPPWLPQGLHYHRHHHQATSCEGCTGAGTSPGGQAVPLKPLSLLRFWPRAGGINVPMAYLGGLFTRFGLHVEDMHLCSLSMLWFGEPKVWYAIPASFADRVEHLIMERWSAASLSGANASCSGALRTPHTLPWALTSKSLLISPASLAQHGIPVYRAVQVPGQIVLTMPRAYHCGFNCGWNVAEAVNWAPLEWLAFSRRAIGWERALQKTGTVNDVLLGFVQMLAALNQAGAALWSNRERSLLRQALCPCVRANLLLIELFRREQTLKCRAENPASCSLVYWIRSSAACLEAAAVLHHWRQKLRLERLHRSWTTTRQRAWNSVTNTLANAQVWRFPRMAIDRLVAGHSWWQEAICVSTLFCSVCRAACGINFAICLECLEFEGNLVKGIRCEEHLMVPCHAELASGVLMPPRTECQREACRPYDQHSDPVDQEDAPARQQQHQQLPMLVVSHLPPARLLGRLLRYWNESTTIFRACDDSLSAWR